MDWGEALTGIIAILIALYIAYVFIAETVSNEVAIVFVMLFILAGIAGLIDSRRK